MWAMERRPGRGGAIQGWKQRACFEADDDDGSLLAVVEGDGPTHRSREVLLSRKKRRAALAADGGVGLLVLKQVRFLGRLY